MDIPQEISDILSEFGIPAGAIALAAGLVRGAGALEKDASESALKYVSDLLIGGGVTSFGKLGATLIPVIFDRVFGSRPLSVKFISRSILSTTLLWLILLALKHPTWRSIWHDASTDRLFLELTPLWYIIDLSSLIKSRYILGVITNRYGIISILAFFILDITASFVLIIAWEILKLVFS